jgi:dihydrodipicolinate synthase/N-acetylneuraminate lyase
MRVASGSASGRRDSERLDFNSGDGGKRMADDTLPKLVEQLDSACSARDAAAARRIVQRISSAHATATGEPEQLGRADALLRTYAAELHGWEIE